MNKLLVIPSWYPRPDDRIHGSFFQEQARLLSDRFDVKVLHIRISTRPSIRRLLRTPARTAGEWARFIFRKRLKERLPDDDVFTQPPLVAYRVRLLVPTAAKRYKKSLDAYLHAINELIASGWKPDLIQAHSVHLGGLAAKHVKERLGIPYVLTEHMPFALCNYPKFMHNDIKIAFREASFVLSLGNDMIRQLGISGIEIEPNLVHNLVDDAIFNRVCVGYEPGRPLKLISVGAASHYKDHRTLLRALSLLRERHVPFTLTLIGLKTWGNLYSELLEFIQMNRLTPVINVIDRVERGALCDLLVSHDVFVMSSVFETYCVSIIEALACGLPVVTTNHGGGSVDLINKHTGALVSVRNYKAMADELENIFLGKNLFDPHNVREVVVSVCGRKAFLDRQASYYDRAIKSIASRNDE